MLLNPYNRSMSKAPQKPDANARHAEQAQAEKSADSAETIAAKLDLQERRKAIRPIPAGVVTESNDAETWEQFAGTTQSFFVKKGTPAV